MICSQKSYQRKTISHLICTAVFGWIHCGVKQLLKVMAVQSQLFDREMLGCISDNMKGSESREYGIRMKGILNHFEYVLLSKIWVGLMQSQLGPECSGKAPEFEQMILDENKTGKYNWERWWVFDQPNIIPHGHSINEHILMMFEGYLSRLSMKIFSL